MSLFESDAVMDQLWARGSVKAPPRDRIKPPPITEGVTGCSGCALRNEWPRLHSPRMGLRGNTTDPDILCIGEAPGEQEDLDNDVFVGPTGRLLRSHLPSYHLERMAFANTVRCRPYDNRTPTAQESFACSRYLDEDLAAHPSIKAILGCGAVPLARFVTESSLMQLHGTRLPIEAGGRVLWYYPVYHPSYIKHLERDGLDRQALPVWRADLNRFFRDLDRWPQPRLHKFEPHHVVIATSYEQAKALIAAMTSPRAIDLETSKLKPYMRGAEVLCAAVSDGTSTVAFAVHHPEGSNDWGLRLLLETVCEYEWIAHNCSFELVWFLWLLSQNQLDTGQIKPFHDSMAMLRLLHEDHLLLELGIGTRIHLGSNVKRATNIDAARINEYTLAQIMPYCGLDAQASALLYRKLIRQMKPEPYAELLARVASTTRMEQLGLPVSIEAAQQLKTDWGDKAAAAQRAASKIYEAKEFVRHHSKEFNLGSPLQLGIALAEYGRIELPKNKNGYNTDEDVLLSKAKDHPLVELALIHREASKQDSTYIDPVLRVNELYQDGQLHPSYTVMHVSTYRSSSSDPNAQNYPKRKHKQVRRSIEAPAGHCIAAADYGQMQVRNLAMACAIEFPERNLVRDLIAGRDIHSYWLDNLLTIESGYLEHLAHETNESDEKKIRKQGRTIIKSDFVFNSFFGGGSDNIMQRTGIAESKIKTLQSWLWEEYPEIKKYHKARRREYADTGSVRSLTGLALGRGMQKGNECINYPIQNAEAEIVFRAQNELSQLAIDRGDPYLHPRINIHDDLTMIFPDERAEYYIDTITPIMLKVRFDWQDVVPLVVEWSVGENWCDLEEVAVFTGEYQP